MKRWFMVILVAFVGCGGSGTEAKSADDMSADEFDATEDMGEESREAGVGTSSETSSAGDSDSGDSSESSDTQQVLQLVIDDEALEPYLRLGEPGRFPLKIAGSGLPRSVELTKATKPVQIVDESAGKAVLVFDEITVTGKEATIRYRYEIESIKGSARLRKREGRWELVNSRVTQR